MSAATFHFKTAELPDLSEMRRFVEERAFKLGANEDDIGEMVLAVNEAVTNILVHGYRSRPGSVQIDVEAFATDLVVVLQDHAPHFDPTSATAPDLSLTLDERPLGGLGVHMMRQFTDELRYRVNDEDANELILIKHAVLPATSTIEQRS